MSESQDATADADAMGTTPEAGPDATPDGGSGGNPYYDGTPGPCGAWTSLTTNVREAYVGDTITLNATAAGSTPANLGYTWTEQTTGAAIGAMGAPSDEAVGPSDVMTFLCTAAGVATITVTVDDAQDGGTCDPHLTTTSTNVTCLTPTTTQVEAAWVELGSTGSATTDAGSAAGTNTVFARVITGAAACPTLTLNGGSAQSMNTRVAPATIALRPTTSTSLGAQYSKPSAFPVRTCELSLPSGTTSAVVNAALPGGSQGITLPLPKADAQTIVVIGDTGCRTQFGAGGTSQWQACNDPTQYAFPAIAEAAAAIHPDLVIHVGDYEYRDNECPPDIAGCAGRPWGYGWDAWQDDFFAPAKPLFAAAPWVVNRGNHESCTRAGQGWFRFLDPNGYDAVPNDDCNVQGAAAATGGGFVNDNVGSYNTPYAVQVRSDTQVVVFDSNNVAKAAIAPTGSNANMYSAYQTELLQVGGLTQSNMFNIWTNHHPLLGLSAGTPVTSPGIALLSVMQDTYPDTLFPPGINMVLEGHTHLFEALDFTSTTSDAGVPNAYPSTFVSGNSGDILDTDLPTPLPDGSTPLPTAKVPPQVANIAHSPGFGFLVMQYQPADASTGASWLLTEYKTDGTTKRTQCVATMNGHTTCNNWGDLP